MRTVSLPALVVTGLLAVSAAGFARADDFDTMMAGGKDAISVGRFKEAERTFLKALELRPGHPEALYGAGFAAMQLGRRKTAVERFEGVLKATYTTPELKTFHTLALTRIGEILLFDRRWDEALAVYERGLQNDSQNAELRYGHGVALRAKGRNDKALREFEEALRIDPKNAGAMVGKASIYYEMGNVPEAFTLLENAAAASPGNGLPYGVMGSFYMDMKKPFESHMMYGHYYFMMRDLKHAADEYRNALAIKETPEAHYSIGMIKLQLLDAREAETHFRRALDLKIKPPDSSQAQLAVALARQGKLTEAMVALRKAIRGNPKEPGYMTQMAWIALQAGDKDEAERSARKALELDPNLAAGYRYLGDVYSSRSQWRDAIGAYEKALSRDPNLDDVYVNLGWAYESSGDLVSAQRNYEVFLTVSTDKDAMEKVRAQIKTLKARQRKAG
jgi:tetratricopeptide (TPR) repeat protein